MLNFKLYKQLTIGLDDEAATLRTGGQFAACLRTGLIVYLHGDLGAGKTTFARGVLRGLGYLGKVKSPTYTLVESYEFDQNSNKKLINSIDNSSFTVHHFDLYRFIDEEEWEAAGFREYFNKQSIAMIEWPEKAQQVLPVADIDVRMTVLAQGRTIQLLANTITGEQCLANF